LLNGRGHAIAVVLARGGSKGLPRKNALPVAGRACIEWTLEHACAAESVHEVVLSTDDEELMSIGHEWRDRGVVVVQRSAPLASDTATIDAAAREAIGQWASKEAGRSADGRTIVILYGNVPVRPAGLIDRAVRMLIEQNADSVQSYSPVGKHHPWWTARVSSESGEVRPWEGEVLNHGVFRRQDLPPAFVPDGGVLVVTYPALMLKMESVRSGPHAFFGRADRRYGVINAEGDVVDIDTRADLLVAEALLMERA